MLPTVKNTIQTNIVVFIVFTRLMKRQVILKTGEDERNTEF